MNAIPFQFYVAIFVFLSIPTSYLKFKRFINPISLVVTWWGGWLYISNFSLTGLYIPEDTTQGLVLLMLSGYVLGCFLCPMSKNRNILKNIELFQGLKLHYFITLCLIIPLFLKALSIFSDTGMDPSYRGKIFGQGEEASILYGTFYIQLIYTFFIYPYISVLSLISIICSIELGRNTLLVLTSVIVVAKSVMTFGRDDIFNSIIIYLVYSIIVFENHIIGFGNFGKFFITNSLRSIHKKTLAFRKNALTSKITPILIVTLLVSVVSSLSSIRSGSENDSLGDTVFDTLISNNTMGFVLLEREISNPASYLNTHLTYGQATFSIIDILLTFIIRRFDSNFIGLTREMGIYQNEFFHIGGGHVGNAYYTMIYNFYLDAREVGVFIFPLLFGLATSFFFGRMIYKKSIISTLSFLSMISMLLASITQSQLSSMDFWGGFVWILLYKRTFSLKGKMVKYDHP
jgi:oligosaccharide repeat unit polymerase